MLFLFFFFFQAEDGIRDGTVTGVQTCALPILPRAGAAPATSSNQPYTSPRLGRLAGRAALSRILCTNFPAGQVPQSARSPCGRRGFARWSSPRMAREEAEGDMAGEIEARLEAL